MSYECCIAGTGREKNEGMDVVARRFEAFSKHSSGPCSFCSNALMLFDLNGQRLRLPEIETRQSIAPLNQGTFTTPGGFLTRAQGAVKAVVYRQRWIFLAVSLWSSFDSASSQTRWKSTVCLKGYIGADRISTYRVRSSKWDFSMLFIIS